MAEKKVTKNSVKKKQTEEEIALSEALEEAILFEEKKEKKKSKKREAKEKQAPASEKAAEKSGGRNKKEASPEKTPNSKKKTADKKKADAALAKAVAETEAKEKKSSGKGKKKSTEAFDRFLAEIADSDTVRSPEASDANNKKNKKSKTKQESGKAPAEKKNQEKKLRIISLGGLGEIGKNMTAFEYGDDIVIIDCGLSFPDDDMFGIDLVIPDFSYIESNREKVRGLLLTHGHEDHIGGVPYFLRSFNVPVYGTALTLGIIRNKLREHKLGFNPSLITVKPGDKVSLGAFDAEFIHVNHSIADACAIALFTPVGTVIHSGDFKLDVSPVEEEMIDLTRFGELGRKGVRLLMCESTNAERAGFTPSEKSVGGVLERVFSDNPEKRIVVATFSSNVHRVKQVIDISVAMGRKVAVTGRSMQAVLSAASELGYMMIPPETVIDISEMKYYAPGEVTLITTGSQGEPMSALYRMAFGDKTQITLGKSDVVVLSSSTIPGNEKTIGRIINELTKNGIKVINGSILSGVHTSGHACAEEIKMLIQLCKPDYYMPVHGEYRHMDANRELAEYMGFDPEKIILSDIGKVLELGKKTAAITGSVQAGRTLIDGYGVGDIGTAVLRDRKLLSEDGVVIIFASVDLDSRYIMAPPQIVTKGFVYNPDADGLITEAVWAASEELADALNVKRGKPELENVRERVRRAVLKLLVHKTGRNPMVIPFITEL
ncbi:MAG: ribonuclease J [Clostridia bacterium]|nr:ribonuclease J [Clostridia bacterium]